MNRHPIRLLNRVPFPAPMGSSLYRVKIPAEIEQRGTGKAINRPDALVYDCMPVLLGDQFRTHPVLSRVLLRDAPVSAPFMLKREAYELLGVKYVEEGDLIPGLECYRIMLESATDFVEAMSRIQGSALLNQREVKKLGLASDLESELMRSCRKAKMKADPQKYADWVDQLKASKKEWLRLNQNNKTYGSAKYIEACLRIGLYEQAEACARNLKKRGVIQKVRDQTPDEILDTSFLHEYISANSANFPESTIGQ